MRKLMIIGLMVAGLMSGLVHSSLAQPDDKKQKLESLKIAYITQQLNLTPEEAQQFWPVYDKYQAELDAIHKARRTELMNAQVNFDQMSDADVSKVIDNEMASQEQELALRKKYIVEFKKVLPVKKVALLLRSEQMFKLKLLKEIQNRQEGKGGGNHGTLAPDINNH